MSFESIKKNGIHYAEIIWADTHVEKTAFFSPVESSFQFGLLAHESGFFEPPHYHRSLAREITDIQQMFVVQRGIISVQFYDEDGAPFYNVTLKIGDAIVLIHGAHSIRVIEDMQCVSIKQGPFLGIEYDKVFVESKE